MLPGQTFFNSHHYHRDVCCWTKKPSELTGSLLPSCLLIKIFTHTVAHRFDAEWFFKCTIRSCFFRSL
jgi:hypothetical protein